MGKYPQNLCKSLYKLVQFYKEGTPIDDEEIIAYMKAHSLREILANTEFWDTDLSFLYDEVAKYADQ